DVMGALVFSFLIGIGLARLQNSKLAEVSYDFGNIISFIIEKVVIPLLPLFIFGIFLDMTYSGKVMMILNVFVKIIGVIFALHILLLLIQYIIAGTISKKNPFKLFVIMMPDRKSTRLNSSHV